MAKFAVGDKEIEIPIMNFRKIKKAWPFFKKAAQVDEEEPMKSFDDGIQAILIGLEGTDNDDVTLEYIEENLKGPQVLAVQATLSQMMKEAGLTKVRADGTIVGNGEGEEVDLPENSTEISTQSSQSLSQPDAKAEAGTE